MYLFLTVCSNKIRKRNHHLNNLDLHLIKSANKVIENMSHEIEKDKDKNKDKDETNFVLSFFFKFFKKTPKPPTLPKPKIFSDATFVLNLISYTKNFILDEARISITFNSERNRVESFEYTCRSKEEIFKSDLGDIDFIRFSNILTKEIQMGIAHHIVLRECFEKVFKCENFDNLCIIKNLASEIGQEMIIFEPGNHGLTLENIRGESKYFESYSNKAVIPKENVKLAILYSSTKHFYFKTQSTEFNFSSVLLNHSPYLIILYTNDKNQNESLNSDCSFCLGDFVDKV